MTTAQRPGIPTFPFEGDMFVEPHPCYRDLRASRPVCPVTTQDGKRGWLITRYEDAKEALTDPRFTRGNTLDEQTAQLMGVEGPSGRMALIYADPPLLTESRKLVSGYFTARQVESLRPRAQQIVDGLIDRMEAASGPVDLLESLARPLPIQIICELLGIPVTDSDAIRRSVELLMHMGGKSGEEIRDAITHVYGYLNAHVARVREQPGDDLLGDLIRYQAHDGTALSESELVGLAMLLFVTGHETTMTQIVNSSLVLLQQDEQRTRLLDHPELLATCVEELLRFVPLGHAGLPFAASEDLEFRDVKMNKGDLVFVSKLSANRDERAFDAADTLDITRTPNRHIAFSHGPHHCLGAALARMELQVAIGSLFSRLPTLRLAVDLEELTWRVGGTHRGPESLPVTW